MGPGGENPFFLGDPAEMGAADEEPRRAVAGSLLRGISTGDFQEALAALLGKEAPNLSPAVISRLTAECQADYDAWQKRDGQRMKEPTTTGTSSRTRTR